MPTPVRSAPTTSPTPQSRRTLALGAWWAALGIALGAFGAHGLKGHLDSNDLAIYETGVRYQMYAALALMALGAAGKWGPPLRLLGLGSLIFSGSLYALVLLQVRWLGAITPIGGLLMIAGLAWLGWQVWQEAGVSSETGQV